MVESEEGNCTGFRFQPSKQRRKSRDKNTTKDLKWCKGKADTKSQKHPFIIL